LNEPTAKIAEFIHLQKQAGKAQETLETYQNKLTKIAKLCDINNPYEIKEALANLKWKNSTKQNTVNALKQYLKFIGKKWEPPKYKIEERVPFIPTEEELNQLIASAKKRYTAYLQTLKETGIRTDELMKLKWTDIDTTRKTISITPSKGSNPRILPISNKLIGMLNALPKTKQTIVTAKKHTFRTTFYSLRKNTAKKLNNPRIKQITPHTFRHWKGTMEYHETKDIMHVKYVLGHKSINSTMIYINIEQAIFLNQTDKYYSATATTIQEAQKLIETGFEYVTEIDGTKLFRKPK
jgi:integrase/recombinase XerD